jgi:predicted lipid-binding transport protein (Tim44 family)
VPAGRRKGKLGAGQNNPPKTICIAISGRLRVNGSRQLPIPARLIALFPFDTSTLIFVALAIFFVWKLRSVLGQKTGSEETRIDPPRKPEADLRQPPPAGASNVIRLPGAAGAEATGETPPPDRWQGFAERGSKIAAGLDAIVSRDAAFDPKSFVQGARAAYEMIVTAFAAGDRKTLKSLLAPDVFESFEHAIAAREARAETMTTTLVSIDKATLIDAQLRGSMAQVGVRFLSKLINVTKDKAGAPVDDMQGKVTDSIDMWTFARDVASRDPNWRLIATESDQSAPKNGAN